ncbi:spinster family MFS transporter [Rhizorhabdus dicambivorans]|uniref:MFS transporter n=1 Tax=Rhizorhabdus dicambivorans TaxID=1850238 RepID=A0A2A4FQ20_9SPHN|nr:MFS transporter [Rhizorhabdus dicambivorans]ATE64665.1 MFS transporter [Rhizorhabdus dicambivorans]PCE39802.1 MFS transporter [Rhizorhabdus dicambivorans]
MHGKDVVDRPADAAYQWTGMRRHLTLALLCLTALFNIFDRQIMTILLEPIKIEFGASDTEMGLLAGSIFALFYAAASIPLGRLADRHSRRVLIAACLAAWSLMSAFGGVARTFVQLALTRVGVAIGEAGSTPASYAIIADLYPLRHRAKALSFYAAASSIGAGAAVMLGGWLVENFGWRTTLVAVGLPGLVLAALLLWLLKDPPRGLSDPLQAARPDAGHSMLSALRHFWTLRSYRWVLLAPAFCQVTLYGTLIWGPTFMLRVHGLSPSEVGLLFGGVTTIALVLGQLSGGMLADWMGSRDIRGYMRFSAAMAGIGIPAGLLFLFAANTGLAMVGFGLLSLAMAPITMCATVMAQSLVPPRMRATSSTALLLTATTFGVGFAPLFVGLSNDFLQPMLGGEAIRYSLAIVVGFLALSSISALIAAKWVCADYDRLQGETSAAG